MNTTASNTFKQNNNQDGFTLVELLITTGLTVLLLLTITSMFMTFLIGNSKTNVRKTVKEEGLHALSQMEFTLKNAHYYDDSFEQCIPGRDSIKVVGLDGGETIYSTANDEGVAKIASNSSRLTSAAVTLSNLTFDCTGESGNRQITVSFDLEKVAPTLNADSDISESFQTTINMRN